MDNINQITNDHNATKKLKLEIPKIRLEIATLTCGLAFIATTAFGGLLLLLYSFRLHFIPGGIAAGDTFSLIFFAVCFTAFSVLILVYTTLAGYPVAYLISFVLKRIKLALDRFHRSKDSTRSDTDQVPLGPPVKFEWKYGYRLVLVGGTCTLMLYILLIISASLAAKVFLLGMLLAGIWLSFFVFGKLTQQYSRLPRKNNWLEQLPYPQQQFIIILVVTVSLVFINIAAMQNSALNAIGFRKHDVSVKMGKEDFIILKEKSIKLGLVMNPCEQILKDTTIISHIDVLWNKPGNIALLRFPTQPVIDDQGTKKIKQFRVEINNSDLTVHDQEVGDEKCSEFLSEAVFLNNKQELSDEGSSLIDNEFSWLSHLDKDWEVVVLAHDAQPTGEGQFPTEKTTLQALAVRNHLRNKFNLDDKSIRYEGRHSVQNKLACDLYIEDFRRKCEKLNRRIEVWVQKKYD